MKALRQADEALDARFGNIQSIKLDDLPGVADRARLSAQQVETALKTVDDQPIDTALATQARWELAGLEKARTRTRDELANNLGKLSDVDGRKSDV